MTQQQVMRNYNRAVERVYRQWISEQPRRAQRQWLILLHVWLGTL